MDSTFTCEQCGAEVSRRRRPSPGMLTFCSAACRSAWRRGQAKAHPKPTPAHKTCRDCGADKPAAEFYTHATRADGLHPTCKECFAKHGAEYYATNRAKIRQQEKDRYTRDPKYRQRMMMNARRNYYQNYEQVRQRKKAYDEQHRDEAREYHRRYYSDRVAWMAEIKSRYACVRCGENHPACLDFHHNDPAQKIFNISEAVAGPWTEAEVMAEIAKCTPMCSNCHRKMHYAERRGRATNQIALPLD